MKTKKLTKAQINKIVKKAEKAAKEQSIKDLNFISKHGVSQLEYWG